MVHVATVLSTLVILWKGNRLDIRGLFKWQLNEETKYILNIVVSMIPIIIVGCVLKDYVEDFLLSGLLIVGWLPAADGCTALTLLCETETEGTYQHEGCVYYRMAQACAVMPGHAQEVVQSLPV